MRDDFSPSVKDTLAKRVGYRCSNPKCRILTSGPQENPEKAINVGVASHITAASSGGPRYKRRLSSEERESPENGIWLCQKCAKLIDNDVKRYTNEKLKNWKKKAEERALSEVEGGQNHQQSVKPALGNSPRRREITELSFDIQGSKINYKVIRNNQNLKIAHRIYIELITRKAAIPFDEENDVIFEVYNSWYSLFKVIREEIKNISDHTLFYREKRDDLELMASDILNKCLRPHLTKYQSSFRKWYEEEIEDPKNRGKSPQEIQRKYPHYSDLINDMKEVNGLLIKYKQELEKFINISKK